MSDKAYDSITITLPGWDDTPRAEDGIYISSGSSDTITLSDLSYGSGANVVLGGISVPWDTTSISDNSYTLGHNWANSISSKIELNGPGADIEINGESLVAMLKNIQERVNILTVNSKLESEWEELRSLGEQYRALEKHILEKQATWDRLKAMPPPEIE